MRRYFILSMLLITLIILVNKYYTTTMVETSKETVSPGMDIEETEKEKTPVVLTKIGACPTLDEKIASSFVALSLKCTEQEFPNKPGDILTKDKSPRTPQEMTPSFFGCFDWHSAVHGHWAMVKALKLFPNLPDKPAIMEILRKHLNKEKIEGEISYFNEKTNYSFERPYGWGWLLRLQRELLTWNEPEAKEFAAALKPLADIITERTIAYLSNLSEPMREGMHGNTAFSLIHIYDYAEISGNDELKNKIIYSAKKFYQKDTSCPANYEPSGEDFVSPCLAEAALMKRVLNESVFKSWFKNFLPSLNSYIVPTEVKDKKDARIGHLIGLDFQRAWSAAEIKRAFSPTSEEYKILDTIKENHCYAGYNDMFDSGYGGAHWLASFAIYFYSENGK